MIIKQIHLACRTLRRNIELSLINITGLSIGMMAVLLIFGYVMFEKSYENDFENADRIHRLVFYRHYETGLDISVGNNYLVGQMAYDKIPEIENFCRCRKETGYFQTDGEIFKEERAFLADSGFFEIFQYPVIAGDKSSFLKSPGVAVITESTARKYFGDEDPLGKTIFSVNPGKRPLTVQGVVRDSPLNSHLKFDIVISLVSLTNNQSYCFTCNNTNTYFLMREGSNPEEVSGKITGIASDYLKSMNVNLTFPIEYRLQPITDIHLHSHHRFEHEMNGNSKYLYILIIIAMFILVSASLNYFNLVYASFSGKRMADMGIKMINGATGKTITISFIIEALFIGVISLTLTMGSLLILFPLIKNFMNLDFNLSSLKLSTWIFPLILFTFTFITVGTVLGLKIYRKIPLNLIKKNIKNFSVKRPRRIVLTTQFMIAIFLIIGVVGIVKQIRHMQHEALSMDIDQTLVVKRPTAAEFNQGQVVFQESLLKLPGISSITWSTIVPGEKNSWVKGGIRIKGREDVDDQIWQSNIAPGFFDFFKVKLLFGRLFYNEETNWDGGVRHLIVNKEAVHALGEDNYENIIGKQLYDSDNRVEIGEVIGVIDGYFQNSLDQEVVPTIFNCDSHGYFIFLKINSADIKYTLANVKTEFEKSFPGQYYESYFLDDFFNLQYMSHIRLYRSFILFAIMAIIITCLSLLGLIVMAATSRIKEIGIRKVNGAKTWEMMAMLNKDFLIWVAIAFVIASPIAYFAMDKWLQNFAYKTELNWWIFALAGVLALGIALLTVSFQSWKAASRNPVEALRYE